MKNEREKELKIEKFIRERQESFMLEPLERQNTNNYGLEENDERIIAAVKKDDDGKHKFELGDIVEFVQRGMQTIIDDEVTKRFTTEELTVWNLLSRTNQQYEYVSFRVTVLWILGFFVRYCLLFPIR